MLTQWLRLFKYNGTTLTDYSLANANESKTVAANLTANTEYFYIAQMYPFNNIFAWVNTVNAVSATLTIQYWDGTTWRDAVDVLDGTAATSGVPFSGSGLIQYAPDRRYRWQKINDTSYSNAPTELQGVQITDLYWIRIKVGSSLTAGALINAFTYSFTMTQELNNLDVELNGFFESFESGKTDWIPEIITGSLLVISDLKRSGLIVHPGQILRMEDVSMATNYKTIILIYRQLGKAYDDKRKVLEYEYPSLLKLGRFSVDKSIDGSLDSDEISNRVYTAVR